MHFFPKLLIVIVGCYTSWKFLRRQTGSEGNGSRHSDTMSSESSSTTEYWLKNDHGTFSVEEDTDNLPRNAPSTANYSYIFNDETVTKISGTILSDHQTTISLSTFRINNPENRYQILVTISKSKISTNSIETWNTFLSNCPHLATRIDILSITFEEGIVSSIALSNFKTIEEFSLKECSIHLADYETLIFSLSNTVTKLSLEYNEVQISALKNFKSNIFVNLHSLKEVYLNEDWTKEVYDKVMTDIAEVEELQKVTLGCHCCRKEFFVADRLKFYKCTELNLSFGETPIDDMNFSELTTIKTLKQLTISHIVKKKEKNELPPQLLSLLKVSESLIFVKYNTIIIQKSFEDGHMIFTVEGPIEFLKNLHPNFSNHSSSISYGRFSFDANEMDLFYKTITSNSDQSAVLIKSSKVTFCGTFDSTKMNEVFACLYSDIEINHLLLKFKSWEITDPNEIAKYEQTEHTFDDIKEITISFEITFSTPSFERFLSLLLSRTRSLQFLHIKNSNSNAKAISLECLLMLLDLLISLLPKLPELNCNHIVQEFIRMSSFCDQDTELLKILGGKLNDIHH